MSPFMCREGAGLRRHTVVRPRKFPEAAAAVFFFALPAGNFCVYVEHYQVRKEGGCHGI